MTVAALAAEDEALRDLRTDRGLIGILAADGDLPEMVIEVKGGVTSIFPSPAAF